MPVYPRRGAGDWPRLDDMYPRTGPSDWSLAAAAYVWDAGSWRQCHTEVGKTAVRAASSDTYRATFGWRSQDSDPTTRVYQGVAPGAESAGENFGCWFYGTLPISGVTVSTATVRVSRLDEGGLVAGVPVRARLHTHLTRPAGAPNLTLGPALLGELARGQTETFTLPAGWGQALVDGTARGLALDGADSEYLIATSVGEDAASGRLTITHS
jgi:hypothetical protein